MILLPRFGIRLHGGQVFHDALAMAKAADEAGFDGLWFAENAFGRGILPLAAACAVATRRVSIGAGVFNPFSRHPTLMAMEIAALDEMSGGRVSLSVGSGIAAAVRQMGLDADRPVPALRDALRIVRGLLAGERVAYAGKVFSAAGVKLDVEPRGAIPIFLAGRGPLTLRLAGELADGLVISNMCSKGYARAARAAAGGGDGFRIVHYMPCCVGEGHEVRARRAVGAMLPGFWGLSQRVASVRDGLLTETEITEAEFEAAAVRLRAGEDAAEVLDARYTRAFSLSGSVSECVDGAAAFAAAGVTDLALTFGSVDEIFAMGRLGSVPTG
jgi:5,10-methylenetetrahydromethanopterin reductase